MIAAAPVADATTRLALMWVVGVGILLLLAMWLHSRVDRVNRPSAARPDPNWGEASGAESTLFPTAVPPAAPTWWNRAREFVLDALFAVRGSLGRGDRFVEAAGKHSPTVGWSPREVRRHLEARADVSDALVEQVRREFIAAGLPPLAVEQPPTAVRVVGRAQVVERPSWDDINRKRAEQDAWLADPDHTGWFPLVPARRDGAR
ncbi:hypothetical protein AB0J14_04375 [Micromonospora arborensis]|uniref:hypothetical protein n=1 Tax=Micromonospora arborensis TaxID=2116518 RepID=UPI0033E175BF